MEKKLKMKWNGEVARRRQDVEIKDYLAFEAGPQCFILSREGNAEKSIPFLMCEITTTTLAQSPQKTCRLKVSGGGGEIVGTGVEMVLRWCGDV